MRSPLCQPGKYLARVSTRLVLGGVLASAAWGQPAGKPRSLESIYPGLEELRTTTREVVCLLDIEHPDEVRAKIRDRSPRFHSLERVRLCIELETAGLPCLLVPASMLKEEDLAKPVVKAVVVCGRNRRLDPQDEARVRALLRECPAPALCSGGGLGLLVTAWGGRTGPMRRLGPGERDPDPAYMPGFLKEKGFGKVPVISDDPLFAGFSGCIEVMQQHSSEVKEVPPDFALLAGTPDCRVQAIRHIERPLYGLQFQPDRFDELRGDGRQVLRNFFRHAGIDVEREVERSRAAYRERTRLLVEKVCQQPRSLLDQTKPYVAVVDMEAPEVVASQRKGSGSGLTHAEKIGRLSRRIEGELAGLPCVVVHYIEAQQEHFANPCLRAIVISGAGSPSADPMARDLFAVIREARVPIMGLCAGHQQIAEAYGVDTVSMRRLREGEKDPHPPYHPGMFKEWGFVPVQVIRRDPLFEGLPDRLVVQEYHVAKVESVPAGFDLLASTDECPIQAITRRGKPVYGTQFHSECYDEAHPDGRRILQNFFRIAAGHAQSLPLPRK